MCLTVSEIAKQYFTCRASQRSHGLVQSALRRPRHLRCGRVRDVELYSLGHDVATGTRGLHAGVGDDVALDPKTLVVFPSCAEAVLVNLRDFR